MDEKQMLETVEHFIRQDSVLSDEIKVTRIPDYKTVFIEQIEKDSGGRAITMTQYTVDGVHYWAGYSHRSQTVFISRG